MMTIENIKMRISDLFSTGSTLKSVDQAPSLNVNPTGKREDETYKLWGLRVCAIAVGNVHTLVPCLHSCYQSLYRLQASDKEQQDEYRRQCAKEIEEKTNNITYLREQVRSNGEQQEEKQIQINEEKLKRDELKSREYEVNKEAKIKLLLGLIILVPLTLYLFLFYSSTFYSAFFKDFGDDTTLMNAMFDANALSKALETSFTELCFVLSAPVIFMGLGFSLHFFSVQENKTKYFKMAAILCVTFVFDAILAYLIGKQLHIMEVTIGAASLDSTYGLLDALNDINTWAVIFCGFIVYIIWGIVFDMSMSAYNQLDLNRVEIKRIDVTIAELKQQIEDLRKTARQFNNQIREIQDQITRLEYKRDKNVNIKLHIIHDAMVEFFEGWMQQMSVLGCSHDKQILARQEFNNTLSSLSLLQQTTNTNNNNNETDND